MHNNKIIIELCNRIGIGNMEELNKFYKEEKQKDDTILNCLMRYYLSIGGTSFKITIK